ncbi:ADP-ribosyltransferase [Bacillus cereus group sp. MYBK234-1]|uniref:ADP-ribosyltransferase n=1 Tax=unclassified Bacillus cereus group TaxID=2750818 RepID=UPI003F791F3D
MKHVNFTSKEYVHLLNKIPEKFYQEFAATEERNSEEKDNKPEDKKIHEIREQTDSWKNDLSSDKKELVEKFTHIESHEETNKTFLDQINEKIYVNNRFSEKEIEGLKETEEIRKMDELLQTAQPLREAVVIQKPLHDFQELLSGFDSDQPSTKEAKQQEAKQSLENLSEGQAIKDLGYLTGSWITDTTSSTLQDSHLVVEIPVDTRGIFYGTSDAPQVLLERNHALYITERFTIKNEKGDSITKLIGTFHPNYPIDFQDNTLAADKWMAPFTAKLEEAPKAERDAILAYTGGKAYDFNEKLRTGQTLKETEKQMAGQIDTLINRVETPSSMVVYRRVDARQFGYQEEGAEVLRENNQTLKTTIVTDIQQKIQKNNTFHNLTYTSTSMSKDPDPTYDAKSRPILLKITLPAGSHAAFIGRESKFPNQQEILLPRDKTFKYGEVSETADSISGQEYKSLVIDVSMLEKK